MTAKVTHPLLVRRCTAEDLQPIMELQEIVCNAITDKDLFISSEQEENAGYLNDPNFTLGCFDGEKLVAYCSFALPEEAEDNLGWILGWPQEKVRFCAKLDTIVVHPEYRGGLQQRLISEALALAGQNQNIRYVLTTVSPKNSHSLHNVQAMGFEILKTTQKYGKERFILGRALALPNNK